MSNCLISQDGTVTECLPGVVHDAICRLFLKQTLKQFFNSKGMRISARGWVLAIEYYCEPSDEQKRIVKRYLREGDFYNVVFPNEVIERFERPIKNINWEGRVYA